MGFTKGSPPPRAARRCDRVLDLFAGPAQDRLGDQVRDQVPEPAREAFLPARFETAVAVQPGGVGGQRFVECVGALQRVRRDDGRTPRRLAPIEHRLERCDQRVGALAVGLVDAEHVADLEQARLHRLHRVPRLRAQDHDDAVGGGGHLDLDLADADRLDQQEVEAGRIHQVERGGCGAAQPPEAPAARE
jgi:hypothetical protein